MFHLFQLIFSFQQFLDGWKDFFQKLHGVRYEIELPLCNILAFFSGVFGGFVGQELSTRTTYPITFCYFVQRLSIKHLNHVLFSHHMKKDRKTSDLGWKNAYRLIIACLLSLVACRLLHVLLTSCLLNVILLFVKCWKLNVPFHLSLVR